MATTVDTKNGGTASGRPLRAIGYLRVSSRGQAERGMGLDVQRERLNEYAKANAYDLVETVQEAASGGVRHGEVFSWEHRPELLGLVERAKLREFDVLLVAKLDRLSRDYATLVILERRFQRFGVLVESVAERNGDGPHAEFVRGQLALIAQLERALILDRVSAGKAAKKREGRHVHGRIPYGYVSAGDGRYRTVPELAPVVRRIFEDARDGYGPARIANGLNRDGIPSPHGGTWSRQTVAKMLRNATYAGERHGVKRAQPSIVSRQLWNAAQRASSVGSG